MWQKQKEWRFFHGHRRNELDDHTEIQAKPARSPSNTSNIQSSTPSNSINLKQSAHIILWVYRQVTKEKCAALLMCIHILHPSNYEFSPRKWEAQTSTSSNWARRRPRYSANLSPRAQFILWVHNHEMKPFGVKYVPRQPRFIPSQPAQESIIGVVIDLLDQEKR